MKLDKLKKYNWFEFFNKISPKYYKHYSNYAVEYDILLNNFMNMINFLYVDIGIVIIFSDFNNVHIKHKNRGKNNQFLRPVYEYDNNCLMLKYAIRYLKNKNLRYCCVFCPNNNHMTTLIYDDFLSKIFFFDPLNYHFLDGSNIRFDSAFITYIEDMCNYIKFDRLIILDSSYLINKYYVQTRESKNKNKKFKKYDNNLKGFCEIWCMILIHARFYFPHLSIDILQDYVFFNKDLSIMVRSYLSFILNLTFSENPHYQLSLKASDFL